MLAQCKFAFQDVWNMLKVGPQSVSVPSPEPPAVCGGSHNTYSLGLVFRL